MTDQIPLPPPDHTEDVHGFVHDTERRYYSEQTMRAYADRLHAARVKTLPTQLMAGLQAEVDALRHQLQTLAELGNASGDAQILRMGYAAARLEIEHLNTQLQAAREEIKRRDATSAPLSHPYSNEPDQLYDQAVALVLKDRKASISYVQRKLRIGYNRSANLLEQMERAGLVSSLTSSGQRDVLVPARE